MITSLSVVRTDEFNLDVVRDKTLTVMCKTTEWHSWFHSPPAGHNRTIQEPRRFSTSSLFNMTCSNKANRNTTKVSLVISNQPFHLTCVLLSCFFCFAFSGFILHWPTMGLTLHSKAAKFFCMQWLYFWRLTLYGSIIFCNIVLSFMVFELLTSRSFAHNDNVCEAGTITVKKKSVKYLKVEVQTGQVFLIFAVTVK